MLGNVGTYCRWHDNQYDMTVEFACKFYGICNNFPCSCLIVQRKLKISITTLLTSSFRYVQKEEKISPRTTYNVGQGVVLQNLPRGKDFKQNSMNYTLLKS